MRTVFRLKTLLTVVGIAEPQLFVPEIAEPVKWSDVELVGEVDDQFHGFNYNYSEGDLKLVFTCESAHEIIAQQYYTHGTDAVVQFLVIDIDRAGVETVDYDGKIDFETIVIEAGRVSASVVLNSIHEKVKARWETPVSMDAFITLDNTIIAPPLPVEIPLPGMTVRETGELRRQGNFASVTAFDGGGAFSIIPDMLTTKVEQTTTVIPKYPALDTLKNVTLLSGGVQVSEPQPLLEPIETPGLYRVEIDWLLKVEIALTKANFVIGKAKFLGWHLDPIVVVRVPGNPDQVIAIAPRQRGSGEGTTTGSKTINARYYADLDLPGGASVLLFIKSLALPRGRIKQLSFYLNTINLRVFIDRKTRAAPSRTESYLLPDALGQTFGIVTGAVSGGKGRIHGSLIERAGSTQATDGPATEYAIATGGQLRGLKKPPVFTLKTLMETLSAHHAAGILYERDPATGRESARIESGAWFYRGGEILKIDEVFEYREEPDLDLLFNQIEIGYAKFPDAGPGVAEEFNTTRTYQTPLINREAKREILCPLIAAGTAIEEARRLGVKKTGAYGVEIPTTTEAGTYDDDGFLLHVASQSHSDVVTFIVEPPKPFPGKRYTAHYIRFDGGILSRFLGGKALKNGDVITVEGTGTPNDGVAYTVIGSGRGSKLLSGLLPTYEVNPAAPMVASGPVAVTWQLRDQPVKLRTNERLDVTGITDPQTAYNLELSPARMLRRHAGFINSGLAYKRAVDTLRCTAYKHNNNLVTQVKPGAATLPGDSDRQLIRDTGNVDLGELDRFGKLFTPEKMYVKARLTRAMQQGLLAAMQNRHASEEKNLGFVSVLSPDGTYVEGYLRRISYDRQTEVATLVLRKKRPGIVPGGPQCADYRNHTYGRFETDNSADPNLYRFCRFSDFA